MSDCHEAIDCGKEMFRGPDEKGPVAATLAHCPPPMLRLQERAVIHWRWFSEKSYEYVIFEHVALSAINPLSERHWHAENFSASFQGPEFPLSEVGQKDGDIRGHLHCPDDDANGN